MRRFVTALILMLLAETAFANHTESHPPAVNILILETMDNPIVLRSCKAFVRELTNLLPDRRLNFIVKNAQGSLPAAMQMLETSLSNEKPDLLVSVATLGTRAVFNATKSHDIPAVFMVVSDPVAEGIVLQIGETSEYNITGKTHVVESKVKVDMLNRIMTSRAHEHDVHKIALLASDYPSSANAVEKLVAATALVPSIEFVPVRFQYLSGNDNVAVMHNEIIARLNEVVDEVDGYWMPPGPAAHDDKLYRLIQQTYQLPLLFSEQEAAIRDGALIGVFTDEKTIGRNAAVQARQIIMGEEARNLPIERPTNFIVAININTAISLGFTIPSDILELAKDNVYR